MNSLFCSKTASFWAFLYLFLFRRSLRCMKYTQINRFWYFWLHRQTEYVFSSNIRHVFKLSSSSALIVTDVTLVGFSSITHRVPLSNPHLQRNPWLKPLKKGQIFYDTSEYIYIFIYTWSYIHGYYLCNIDGKNNKRHKFLLLNSCFDALQHLS